MKHGEQRDPRPFGCFSAGSAAFGLRLFALTLVFSLAALSHASLQSLVSRPADSRVTPAEAMPREATQAKSPSPSRSVPVLASSARPPVPNDLSVLWLVPAPEEMERLPNALTRFAEGVRLYLDGKIDQALPLVSAPALQATPLADYATYYRGLVLVGLGRVEEARQVFASVSERSPQGYLGEAAPLREAETADAVGDVKSALRVYEKLAGMKTARPDDIWMRMAKAAEALEDRERAGRAWMELLYGYPLSELAKEAAKQVPKYTGLASVGSLASRRDRELARAERLFQAGRYTDARAIFASLRPLAKGDDAALVGLRMAECDYHLRRYRAARDQTNSYLNRAPYQAEALYYNLSAIRRLGATTTYVKLARQLAQKYPSSPWAERALDDLATYYIVADEDAEAEKVFHQVLKLFPEGRHAERAAWRAGWWAFRRGSYKEAVRLFEETAARFPTSDYRPAYLYWSARAYEKAGELEASAGRYGLATTDYMNTYYGRLSVNRLKTEAVAAAAARLADADGGEGGSRPPLETPEHPPTAPLIRMLLSLELYGPALDELQHAERNWGSTRATQATIAYIYNRTGDLRRAINLMKRAYPQYMADGGQDLPVEILKVIFPLAYWTEIRKYAAAHSLDPYLLAALICQESTFQADIRSAANAYGLMQIIPATGRRLARQLGIRFTTSILTRPDTNLRLGTFYLASLLEQFGNVHLALAGYNAGEHRVRAWLAERPPLEQDEFIDDIPFPETQNYIKRILGTTEDYRRLYGGEARGTKSQG